MANHLWAFLVVVPLAVTLTIASGASAGELVDVQPVVSAQPSGVETESVGYPECAALSERSGTEEERSFDSCWNAKEPKENALRLFCLPSFRNFKEYRLREDEQGYQLFFYEWSRNRSTEKSPFPLVITRDVRMTQAAGKALFERLGPLGFWEGAQDWSRHDVDDGTGIWLEVHQKGRASRTVVGWNEDRLPQVQALLHEALESGKRHPMHEKEGEAIPREF